MILVQYLLLFDTFLPESGWLLKEAHHEIKVRYRSQEENRLRGYCTQGLNKRQIYCGICILLGMKDLWKVMKHTGMYICVNLLLWLRKQRAKLWSVPLRM